MGDRAEQFKLLVRRRGFVKKALTEARSFVDLDPEGISESLFRMRYRKFNELFDRFDKVQCEIEEFAGVVDVNSEEAERKAFEDGFMSCDVIFQRRLSFFDNNLQNNSFHVGLGNGGQNNQQIRLPTINLPSFSGNLDQYLSFWDTFDSLVHTNQSINKTQKFHYLKSSLTGEALRAIEGLNITDVNYDRAIELVKKRFNNKRAIVNAHINEMVNFCPVKNESAQALRGLIDSFTKQIGALGGLDVDTTSWGPMLLFIFTGKLDCETRKQWELSLADAEVPPFQSCVDFVLLRCVALESMHSETVAPRVKTRSFNAVLNSCVYCKLSHFVSECPKFKELNAHERFNFAKLRSLCINCLRSGHNAANCRSGKCRKCGKGHHGLLHFGPVSKDGAVGSLRPARSLNSDAVSSADSALVVSDPASSSVIANFSSWSVVSSLSFGLKETILFTALVKVKDRHGNWIVVRSLLDSGSQSSFVTSRLAETLGLGRVVVDVELFGIGRQSRGVEFGVDLTILSSVDAGFVIDTRALVLPVITSFLPHRSFALENVGEFRGLRLADPSFNSSSGIDLLLAADILAKSFRVGTLPFAGGTLVAVNSAFGWLISGIVPQDAGNSTSLFVTCLECSLESRMEKFWELESPVFERKRYSIDEIACERHFADTFERDDSGQFVLRLPFVSYSFDFSHSRQFALNRLVSMENRFGNNPRLKSAYVEFLNEYERLGHMVRVPVDDCNCGYYLPHHGVFRESSTTTKLRVVFDGSSTFTARHSLNDFLYPGPKLQNELLDILLRFRLYRIVFAADVEKMFRQIGIHPDDQNYLKILWRDDPSEPLREYKLTTVTYGTRSAPYQANRCLKQIAVDCVADYPVASRVISNDCYVDDFLSGCDTLSDAVECYEQLTSVLGLAHFHLRKWMSNDLEFLERIPVEDRYSDGSVELFSDGQLKVLGVFWIPSTDVLKFDVKISSLRVVTKREILSRVVGLFDPFGLVGPVVVIGKILMKKLWLSKLDWDQPVTGELKDVWSRFSGQLDTLNEIVIPRFVGSLHQIHIHGFCDASEEAYGACVYAQVGSNVFLLVSKSRVAPIKRVTIPRLELCAAHLLVQVLKRLLLSLGLSSDDVLAWTDSEIVLAWISRPAGTWKTFVANRVEEIQSVLRPIQFRHVAGVENPADLLSRGLDPSRLKLNRLWWNGPPWLSGFELTDEVCMRNEDYNTILEVRKPKVFAFFCGFEDIFCRFSRFATLIRVFAYVYRFINSCRTKVKLLNYLTASELNASLLSLCRLTQKYYFLKDYTLLSDGRSASKRSKLLSLNPFIDDNGLLRLSGRFEKITLKYDSKYPIILPHKARLSKLIVRNAHILNLHVGFSVVCSAIRTRFWIIGVKSLVKFVIRTCVVCQRNKKVLQSQLMGSLPPSRIEYSDPFTHVGIDYCGPFQTAFRTGRGRKTILKSYGCVFVCFSTKAAHLEVVSDLSTEAFLAALNRFVSRRGCPSHIYSDNAKNFVGAKSKLDEFGKFLCENHDIFASFGAQKGITWHFIPAYTPHMGGLWEACVKSLKYHLNRVVGQTLLTFEELATVFAKVEACLNSRPLCPVSNNVDDLTVLTPGHFLIGRALLTVPDADVVLERGSFHGRWSLYQRLVQCVWTAWKDAYLAELMVRSRWKRREKNLVVGDLVVVREKTICATWTLGRITKIHLGKDNCARVADLRTSGGVVRRSVHNMVLISLDSD